MTSPSLACGPSLGNSLAKSALDMLCTELIEYAKDLFSQSTILALSVVDFSKPLASNPPAAGVPISRGKLKLAAAVWRNSSATERTPSEGRQLNFSCGIASAKEVNFCCIC